jgi:glutamate 5-kinase
MGVVPIINENDSVGTQEIRFGDNDRLAALVSLLVNADLLVLISDVDALYDAPPSHSGAKAIHLVDRISDIESIEIGGAGSAGVGSGGMVTKIEAARISTSAGIPMLLTSLAKSAARSLEKNPELSLLRTVRVLTHDCSGWLTPQPHVVG